MVPTVTLNNGHQFPVTGLGTYNAGKKGEVEQVVKDAIDAGYRHIDGAMIYENEEEVGAAINAKIAEGVIKREDIFVTSKLWNTYHKAELVQQALKKTLSDMQLEYLDLYLIHWPFAFKEGGDLMPKDENDRFILSDVDYVETWKAMEKCVELGLTKSIGVSNFNSEQIQQLLKVATVKPVTNQIQHGTVPIPKSSNKKRLQENIDIFNFKLSEQDVAAIDSLNRNARICTFAEYHKLYPFNIEF